MTHANDLHKEQQQAQEKAQRRLKWALAIVQNHQGDVVFKKEVPHEKGALVITVRLPGVIRVSDALHGDVLAESAPGNLLALADGFKAPIRYL